MKKEIEYTRKKYNIVYFMQLRKKKDLLLLRSPEGAAYCFAVLAITDLSCCT